MLDAFVSLDLETTGLNMDSDQIIEVGATRFDRTGSFENFATFIDPGRGIPREVRELTGIADADLKGAPRFGDVREALREFIGDRAIVGQNIAFDLAFLRAEQILPPGPAFDTWELASVLLPTATRLNLGSLAVAVGVHMPVAHRALADAEATRDIFLALLAKLEALPRSLLLELRAFAARADWAFASLIDDALAKSGGLDALDGAAARTIMSALPLPPARVHLAPLVPRDPALPALPEEIAALFTLAAARTDLLPAYERRAGQETMAQAVARHLHTGGALAVEAGTGTGKSLAYLLPALLHALRNDDRVVISTHTLNLQDQLANKDLPVASALVEEIAGFEPGSLRATVLKGRTNYLCRERWAQVRMDPSPRSEPEVRLFGRVAAWLPGTETGDLTELYMTSQERPAWEQINADGTDCLQRRCAYVRDGSCFLLRARARAASAHAVVVNHALLLANAARADQVLPPYRHLVIDEAHRLEDVATQHYGASFSARDVRDLIDRLGQLDRHGEAGFVRRLQGIGQGSELALSPLASLAPLADRLEIAVAAAREHVRPFADALRAFADEHAEENGGPRREISLTAARRAQPAWEEAAEAAMQLDLAMQIVAERVIQVRDAAGALPEGASVLAEALRGEATQAAEALGAARDTLRRTALQPRRDDIAWLAIGEGDQRLHLAPLEVAERLEHDLYRDRASILLTSATLTAAGSFDFTLDRLGLREADTLEVPSPFDYRRAVLALLVEDLPEPGMPGYDRALHETLAGAARAAGGRTLALFTSHAAVRAASNALRDLLARDDIVVLAQGIDGSPGRLLRLLVERPRTILLGTAAFWEGIDVQGDALSQILITRLPFPVPNEPIYAGRAEQFADPFAEFAVPQSVLRFRQGFGRLIRGTTDRGVFAVLDSRIVRRSYGEIFVDALPDCEVRRLRADALPRAVEQWLE
ncbi:MAG: helicase C-terminal domain-containing protein [Dehalococcoidia bacterium]